MIVARHTFWPVLSAIRWFFGAGWLLFGSTAAVWAPIAASRGDDAAFYLLVGGLTVALLGWLIHPWGWQRRRSGKSPEAEPRHSRA
jgi:hypothetical protein